MEKVYDVKNRTRALIWVYFGENIRMCTFNGNSLQQVYDKLKLNLRRYTSVQYPRKWYKHNYGHRLH